MNLQLVLKNNTIINIVESGISGHIVVQCDNSEEFNTIWGQLTPEALEEYTIKKDGEVVQSVVNGQLTGTQTVTNNDDTLTCHFYLKGDLVAQSDEYSEVGRIMMGEE